jgi:CheY-like chemotaxis protein
MKPERRGQAVILVVDDDDYVYGAVRAVLRPIGATVVRAATAAEAVVAVEAHRPALAIVDVGLPDGDGYELARTLKTDLDAGGLRIVILTGHAPDRSAADAAHVDAVIAKPFRMHEFLATVERLLPSGSRSGSVAAPSGGR